MAAILNFAAILENGYLYSFSKSYIHGHWPQKHIFRHLTCEYLYLYNFLAKNVRHFGFGPLAACSTNYIVLDF